MTKSNDDVQVVVDLVDKERQRRVVDKWFQDRTKAFLGTGKWVLAVIAMILAFKDQMAGLIEHVIEYIRFTRGE
ncbi:MAG: hypothetical protein CMM07_25610 [Rhodopirellula sp.]|nr:hypothetical protein [Rhodopirellula sp.]